MKFKEEDVKLYDMFSVLGTENTEIDKENALLLEHEIINQRIDCSRIIFKEHRDAIAKVHEGYALESHDGNEGPDVFSKEMYQINRQGKDGTVDYSIGRIVDYEIPLKRGGEAPIEIGNINLITETMDKIYLIVAKGKDSEESILRTVLESITKLNMMSRRKLLVDFNQAGLNKFKYEHHKDDIIPAIMLFEGTRPYEEFRQLTPDSFVARLVYKYHINFFLLKKQKEEKVYTLID